MNNALSLLIQVGGFAGLLGTVLVPWLTAEYIFGLRRPWPILIGLTSLGITLFGLYRWLLHSQRKERTVLATVQHAVFGEVRCLKDHWEASVSVTHDSPHAEVWGQSESPTESQVATFAAIKDRYPELLSRATEAARTAFATSTFSLSLKDLHLEGIYLPADDFGDFDLSFSVPAHEQYLPWGITVRYADFALDEISDNH